MSLLSKSVLCLVFSAAMLATVGYVTAHIVDSVARH